VDHRVSALISIDEMNTTDTGLRRHRGGQERVVGRRPGACSAKAVLQPQEKTSPWKISRGICSVQTAKKATADAKLCRSTAPVLLSVLVRSPPTAAEAIKG